jgi:hypothetical protein
MRSWPDFRPLSKISGLIGPSPSAGQELTFGWSCERTKASVTGPSSWKMALPAQRQINKQASLVRVAAIKSEHRSWRLDPMRRLHLLALCL